MEISVCSTSWMRTDETAARGTKMNMITAPRTENRMSARYWMKAVRLPMGIAPLSTRMAPNHMTATVERLTMAVSVGMVSANRRLTLRPVS